MTFWMLSGVPAGFLNSRTQSGEHGEIKAGAQAKQLAPASTCRPVLKPPLHPPKIEGTILRFCGRRGSFRHVEAAKNAGTFGNLL